MADTKVSALTDATAVVDADEFLIVQSGVSKRLTAAELGTYMGSELGSTFAAASHAHAASDITSGTMAAARLPSASDTASGIVELATTAETATGTDTGRAVTPAGLAGATSGTTGINARVAVKSSGSLVAARRGINFIPGTNVTMSVVDDSVNEEVDITINASGGGGSAVRSLLHPISKVGSYSRSYSSAGQLATQGLTLNRVYYVPLLLWNDITIDRLGVSVSTAGSAGAVLRLGIYNSDTEGVPSTLVVDAGTVASTSVAAVEATLSQALSAGLYWVAVVAQVATCSTHADGSVSNNFFIYRSSLSLYHNTENFYQDGVSGALPGTATPTAAVIGSLPGTAYRRSA